MTDAPSSSDSLPGDAFRAVLKSQYHAALAMLRQAIERCPSEIWDDERNGSRCWQIAYHALYIAHAYLSRDVFSFRPWEGHQAECQYPDGIPGPPKEGDDLPLVPDPYTRDQVLDYWEVCDAFVDPAVDDLDLHSAESGFPWYPISKLEHQLVNLRHVQHHAAQLADRVRAAEDVGIDWVGARPPG